MRERERDDRLPLITYRRAEVLRGLADGYSEREVAARLGVTVHTIRAHVRDLLHITGCAGVRELGRWWRAHRTGWLEELGVAAGITAAGRSEEDADDENSTSGV